MKNEINKKELRAIAKAIIKEPKRFHMDGWVRTHDSVAPCGTTGCIAGWAIMREAMRREKVKWTEAGRLLDNKTSSSDYSPEAEGAKLLGLTFHEARALFFINRWPDKFQLEYNINDDDNLTLRKKRAKVTAARIEHFIKTGV